MKFMNFADLGETCETWNIFEGLTWININLQSFTSIAPSNFWSQNQDWVTWPSRCALLRACMKARAKMTISTTTIKV